MIELIVRVLLACALYLGASKPEPELVDPCEFERVTGFVSYDNASETFLAARQATDGDRAALLRLNGIYDWVGYEAGGFDRPPLEAEPIRIHVVLDDGAARYVYLYDDLDPATDTQWVWAFRSLTVSTDTDGNYLGLHDICASGGWPLNELAALLSG